MHALPPDSKILHVQGAQAQEIFPAANDPLGHPRAGRIESEEIRNASILVVDDQPANVCLLEEMLRSLGYTHIVTTTDSRTAASLYVEHEVDLVLLDLNMPYLDGFGVMSELRAMERDSYLPVIVLTAELDAMTRQRALEAGAKDFVTKPFDRVEVLTRIRNMLEVRLLHNRVRAQNKLLEDRVRERTLELRDTQLEIIRRLSRAAEFRDNETGLHIVRMSKYAMLLGRAVGMNEREAELLLNASPMHDIGKISIPDRILFKRSRLDAEEREVMRTHAAVGADLLSGHASELMEMARIIALTHHEKWDGSGYPRGLKGECIPLVGRIVALADVFDALTSERPYKPAWEPDAAIAYIQARAGRHFDPALVPVFNRLMPEILEVKRTSAESATMETAAIKVGSGN